MGGVLGRICVQPEDATGVGQGTYERRRQGHGPSSFEWRPAAEQAHTSVSGADVRTAGRKPCLGCDQLRFEGFTREVEGLLDAAILIEDRDGGARPLCRRHGRIVARPT